MAANRFTTFLESENKFSSSNNYVDIAVDIADDLLLTSKVHILGLSHFTRKLNKMWVLAYLSEI